MFFRPDFDFTDPGTFEEVMTMSTSGSLQDEVRTSGVELSCWQGVSDEFRVKLLSVASSSQRTLIGWNSRCSVKSRRGPTASSRHLPTRKL